MIGAERERRKGEGPTRSPAGIRTFTIASLAGAISVIAGGQVLLAIATAGVILLTAAAYWRGHDPDPGLTTEIALIVTTLLGGLSMQTPALAPAWRSRSPFYWPSDLGSITSSARYLPKMNSRTA